MRAALQYPYERGARVLMRGPNGGVEVRHVPINALSDKRSVGNAERYRNRVQWREERSAGMSVGTLAGAHGWRSLILCQAVNVVIEQQNRKVHVVADGVDPVRRTNRATVAVAHDDKHMQVGAAAADAAGHRQRPAVESV